MSARNATVTKIVPRNNLSLVAGTTNTIVVLTRAFAPAEEGICWVENKWYTYGTGQGKVGERRDRGGTEEGGRRERGERGERKEGDGRERGGSGEGVGW